MDKSERQRNQERNKRLKKQRKSYAREEKESVKRQRLELKKRKHRHSRQVNVFSWFLALFDRKTIIQDEESQEKSKSKSRRAKRVQQYLHDQKQSSRNERKMMRKKTRPMRQRMRRSQFEQMKKTFLDFIKHPIKRRKRSKEEKILLKHIRQDIRRERIQWITGMPSRINKSFKEAIFHRKAKMQFQWSTLADPLSEFNDQFHQSSYRILLIKTLINSILMFVLAFWLVYLSNQMVSILIGKFFSIPAVLYSYRIFWPLYTYSSLYSRQALIVIFGLGPLSSLILAIAGYRIYLWARKFRFNIKVFILWLAIHGFNMFFGAYISGMITRTGFIYTTEWLFFSNIFDVEEIIFLIFSIIGLIIIGVYSTRQFILASNSPDIIQPRLRFFYILAQVFLPWLVGNGIILMLNFPNNPPEFMLLIASSGLMVLPAFTNFNTLDNQMIKTRRFPLKIAWIYILIMIVLVFIIRMILFNGINFN